MKKMEYIFHGYPTMVIEVKMIMDAIKHPVFGSIVSLMFGIAIVVVVYPMCHGKSCMIVKAPPIHEVTKTVYQIGTKCYKFETTQIDCPQEGIVESFQMR